MSDEKESVHLTEALAHRILVRATELEQAGLGATTVLQLRDLAREAGISMHAFDAALREAESSQLPPEARPRVGWLRRLWVRLQLRGAQDVRRADVLTVSVTAALLFWVLTFVLTRFAVASGWQAMELTILASTLIGAGIARSMHARLVAVGLLGLAAFQSAEFVMHSIAGIQAVQGGPTHWAVMIAGVLGALLGARFERGAQPALPLAVESANPAVHVVATNPQGDDSSRASFWRRAFDAAVGRLPARA